MSSTAAATQLLTQHLHALPHPDYGIINMLPFAHNSEQTHQIKRQVAEAIISLLDSNGFLGDTTREPTTQSTVVLRCNTCAIQLAELTIQDGTAAVNASQYLAAIAALNPACPHNTLTIDDHRRHMERQLHATFDESALRPPPDKSWTHTEREK